MPLLPMDALTESQAFLAVRLVLVEPDPAKDDDRSRLRPSFEHLMHEALARHRLERGERGPARRAALKAASIPSTGPAALEAWRRAWPDVQTVGQLASFLTLAVKHGDERLMTLRAATEAWVANVPTHQRRGSLGAAPKYLERIWRRYRPAAHIAAAFLVFKKEGRTDHRHLLAYAGWILETLDRRPKHGDGPILDPAKAWVVPPALGLPRAEVTLSTSPDLLERLCKPRGN